MNHTGKGPDDKNIEIAVNSFDKFMEEINSNDQELRLLLVNSPDKIKSLIRLTKFPHTNEEIDSMDGMNIQQRIMRDADMMSAIEESWIQTTISMWADLRPNPMETGESWPSTALVLVFGITPTPVQDLMMMKLLPW